MNDTCGCCQGTQQLTPKRLANRPGLEALAYRLGTHAAFLETMKARLSNFYLDIPQESPDAADTPPTARLYPLRGLTTRTANDPSIALLDAWATVADVLTFYQERIANEGYLRTATERRSILELARLVGYALRPGVASTVYLAYTVDENAKEPVTIPIGARVQSIPGPGELPQSFETVEPLEARAAWNLLKPRMTRPQTAAAIRDANPHPRVYLKGISTNLKLNDPLLISFGDDAQPELYRVMEVKPDAAADRTLVKLQAWVDSGSREDELELTRSSPETIASETKCQLNDIVERYLGDEADRIGLSRGEMFNRVSGHLVLLRQQLAENVPFPAMFAHLNGETLPKLEQERQTAEQRGYTDLEPWLKNMTADLSGVAECMSIERAEALAREFIFTSTAENAGDVIGMASFAQAIGTPVQKKPLIELTKRPSIPPRNALALSRKSATAFQPQADTPLQILGVSRADVRDALPIMIANTKVTPDVPIKVYALRVKAAAFGHNALPRPVHFDRERQMVVNGEWTINNPLNQTEPVARFYAYPQSGLAPLTVKFTDSSTGDITSFSWDFGDGSTSNVQSPAHCFEKQGGYTVKLTVRGPLGTNSAEEVIRVSESAVYVMASTQVVNLALTEPLYHQPNILFLDAEYNISPQSWIALQSPGKNRPDIIWLGEQSISHQSLAAYGLSGKTTRLNLGNKNWFSTGEPFSVVRNTTIYAQSEELALAEAPIDDAICGSDDALDPYAWIELDGVYSGLLAGRWIIVSGERADIKTPDPDQLDTDVPVTGIQASELVMLSEVTQRLAEANPVMLACDYYGEEPQPLPGERYHTYIRFAQKLEYCYKRDTVKIYGNVVKATHGETRNEVLGNGDGSKAFQSFALKQPPLTYVAAPTPDGAESTLHVRVNDVEWHKADSLASLGPTDRNFITRTDNEGKTIVIFGNGEQGARPPTGVENIKAVYRSGIGQAGNVKAEQVSMLVTRPLGVKEVINPLRASGGADKESRDQARKNAPLAVLALDRLVSTQDYADFACTFAGIGKASAARLSDVRRQLVHVTIAGANDIPIDRTSDLYRNLVKALRENGDPYQPIKVEMRELMLIVLSANVRVHPDYQWESVAPRVRARLLDTFSFERRELGQDVLLSEVISAMQAVEGVAYVDVDMLRGIPEETDDEDNPGQRRLLTLTEISDKIKEPLRDAAGEIITEPISRLAVNMADFESGVIHPAQLAFLTPEVEATLILNEVKV